MGQRQAGHASHHKSLVKQWSRAACLLICLFTGGCSEGAKLVQETEAGGIVTYPFKGESGYMFTRFRQGAIELIEKRCNGRYTILKEGEAKGRNRVVQNAVGEQEAVSERRWGIQFQCKQP
jgi:hypothetical protein